MTSYVIKKRKGKILKVRMGYNANSSSISTIVTVFLWGATASVTIINTISALVFANNAKGDEGEEDKK